MSPTGFNSPIVIVGAGIIGLDVALVLAERGFGSQVTVVAEHMPGDTAPTYTSPWAGCNFSTISSNDKNALRWDHMGYAHLTRLATQCSREAYVERTPSFEYWEGQAPIDKVKDISKYLEDFRVLPSSELIPGTNFGISFTALTINAPKHIEFLYKRLKHSYGVTFVRRRLSSLDEAYANPATRIVFNCVGVAAATFDGVKDPKCFPTRGQILLARAPQVKRTIMRHGLDALSYVIPRPGTDGHVVLGGLMQKKVGDCSTYAHDTESILSRTRELCAELREGQELLGASTGLRPSREGGARIEREDVTVNGNKRILVHNYGAGGTGFQAGYGMATDSVQTIESELGALSQDLQRPRL